MRMGRLRRAHPLSISIYPLTFNFMRGGKSNILVPSVQQGPLHFYPLGGLGCGCDEARLRRAPRGQHEPLLVTRELRAQHAHALAVRARPEHMGDLAAGRVRDLGLGLGLGLVLVLKVMLVLGLGLR